LIRAPFLTAGFPSRASFVRDLHAVARVADLVEIGVPFSDPMADGVTIQRASAKALENGATLTWILDTLRAEPPDVPIVLMSYLNPLLAYGVERLAEAEGITGFIVPDLPLEEQGILPGLPLIQLVSPATPRRRAERIAEEARGFLYAIAVKGTTGGSVADRALTAGYLARVKAAARCPVLAGFGVRSREDVAALVPPADGVIVGSALIEAIERGEDPAAFLREVFG
jgi:tryptophan synthase alpha chain